MSAGLKLTVAEYDRMVEKGAFDELAQKIELINGEIQGMNPSGPMHDDYVRFLTRWSFLSTNTDEVAVSVQSGLVLPELDSRPEPDIAWLTPGRYLNAHPTAADVLLLIEVSYSSLKSDQQEKEQLYAAAGIPEYWIVDVLGEQVHVHQKPDGSEYKSISVAKPGETLAPLAAPEAGLNLSELFASE